MRVAIEIGTAGSCCGTGERGRVLVVGVESEDDVADGLVFSGKDRDEVENVVQDFQRLWDIAAFQVLFCLLHQIDEKCW